jgi:hypothetical protein
MEYYRFGGKVGVSTGIGNDGTAFVAFEHLNRMCKIGENLNPADASPETYLIFNNLESIDVVIEKLKHAKDLLKREMLNHENDEYDYGHDINNRNYEADY